MAELPPNISVAVEKAVHDALRIVAQAIFDKHGICIHYASFEWLDLSGMDKPRYVITKVNAQTTTFHSADPNE